MSISGPPPVGGGNRVAGAYGVTPGRRPPSVEAPAARVESPATAIERRSSNGITAKSAGIPLSAVLNDEERAYFDQIEAMGPITYGPSRRAGMAPDAPRGLRLDVRG